VVHRPNVGSGVDEPEPAADREEVETRLGADADVGRLEDEGRRVPGEARLERCRLRGLDELSRRIDAMYA